MCSKTDFSQKLQLKISVGFLIKNGRNNGKNGEMERGEGPSLHENEVFIMDFFSKYDQICGYLRISSHLLKKSLIENFIFCGVCLEISSVSLYIFGCFNIWHHTLPWGCWKWLLENMRSSLFFLKYKLNWSLRVHIKS